MNAAGRSAWKLAPVVILGAVGGGMAGWGAICGCPATCSPGVCVNISWGCAPEAVPGAECEFRFCSMGATWTSPGDRQVTWTGEPQTIWCRVHPGVQGPTGCVPSEQTPYYLVPVQAILEVRSRPCPGSGDPVED